MVAGHLSGSGKFGRLRRLRVGAVSAPLAHPERVRGPRARNAARLKEIVSKIAGDARAGASYHDVDALEPPVPPRRVAAPRPDAELDDEDDL